MKKSSRKRSAVDKKERILSIIKPDLSVPSKPFKLPEGKVVIMMAQPEHVPGIIDLQRRNHKKEVGVNRRGYVTCIHEESDLLGYIQNVGIIVVICHDKVVGYNILCDMDDLKKSGRYWYRLAKEYQKMRPEVDLRKVVISRQYCVDESFRGGVVVKDLYNFQNALLRSKGFCMSIGQVDQRNHASLLAVKRLLGYTFLGSYKQKGITWWFVERPEM